VSHHVLVRLPDPDGRTAIADYRQPVVHVMHRILARRMMTPADCRRNPDKAPGSAADLADYELIAEWLDHCPDAQCHIPCDSCTHEPARPDPGFSPPPYKRPVLDGLW